MGKSVRYSELSSLSRYHGATELNFIATISPVHCVKSVRIRSFFGPYFPAFGPEKPRVWALFTQRLLC